MHVNVAEVSMRSLKTIVASATVLLMAASAFGQLNKDDLEKLNDAAYADTVASNKEHAEKANKK